MLGIWIHYFIEPYMRATLYRFVMQPYTGFGRCCYACCSTVASLIGAGPETRLINPAFVCSSEKMSSEKKVFAVARLRRRVQFDEI